MRWCVRTPRRRKLGAPLSRSAPTLSGFLGNAPACGSPILPICQHPLVEGSAEDVISVGVIPLGMTDGRQQPQVGMYGGRRVRENTCLKGAGCGGCPTWPPDSPDVVRLHLSTRPTEACTREGSDVKFVEVFRAIAPGGLVAKGARGRWRLMENGLRAAHRPFAEAVAASPCPHLFWIAAHPTSHSPIVSIPASAIQGRVQQLHRQQARVCDERGHAILGGLFQTAPHHGVTRTAEW